MAGGFHEALETLGEHPRQQVHAALLGQARQYAVRHRADAELHPRAVGNEIEHAIDDLPVAVGGRWGAIFPDRRVCLDGETDPFDRHPAVAGRPRHIGIDLGDHQAGGADEVLGEAHRDAEAHLALA